MGLDMYLEKRTYVKNWDYMGPEERHNVVVTRNGEQVSHIKPERVSCVIEQVGYWRKANQIHRWFVENIQEGKDDCKSYWLDINDLMKLLNVCKDVMDDFHKTGGVSAHALLPREQGFFFGSEEYDEYYFGDVSKTINIIENLLSEVDEKGYFPGDLYYSSSW